MRPLYDSHCHLHDPSVLNPDEQIVRARAAGVERMLLAGVDGSGWWTALALKARFPQLRLAFGVHPQAIHADPTRAGADVDDLASCLDAGGRLPRPAAIGETGLDGSDAYADSLEIQAHEFRRHIEMGRRHALPLVLHVLRAHPRALSILEQEALPPRPGVLHSCSASAELVQRYLELGFLISFSGAVANPAARKLHAAARAVPLDRLLVETDAPFQTPAVRRPARNEPAFLVEIVGALAQIRGESAEGVAHATYANACRLFDEE
jgi:TatD DNase family protein